MEGDALGFGGHREYDDETCRALIEDVHRYDKSGSSPGLFVAANGIEINQPNLSTGRFGHSSVLHL